MNVDRFPWISLIGKEKNLYPSKMKTLGIYYCLQDYQKLLVMACLIVFRSLMG